MRLCEIPPLYVDRVCVKVNCFCYDSIKVFYKKKNVVKNRSNKMNITKLIFTKAFTSPSINPVFSCLKKYSLQNLCWITSGTESFPGVRSYSVENLSKLATKKRPQRKKWTEEEVGKYNVVAYATAEEYNLEGLVAGLIKQDLYEPKRYNKSPQVISTWIDLIFFLVFFQRII